MTDTTKKDELFGMPTDEEISKKINSIGCIDPYCCVPTATEEVKALRDTYAIPLLKERDELIEDLKFQVSDAIEEISFRKETIEKMEAENEEQTALKNVFQNQMFEFDDKIKELTATIERMKAVVDAAVEHHFDKSIYGDANTDLYRAVTAFKASQEGKQ